jgi:hypothetical protein
MELRSSGLRFEPRRGLCDIRPGCAELRMHLAVYPRAVRRLESFVRHVAELSHTQLSSIVSSRRSDKEVIRAASPFDAALRSAEPDPEGRFNTALRKARAELDGLASNQLFKSNAFQADPSEGPLIPIWMAKEASLTLLFEFKPRERGLNDVLYGPFEPHIHREDISPVDAT